MTRRKRPAEEREGTGALVKDGAEPRSRSVVVDHEHLVEVGHLQNRPGGEGALERREGRLGLIVLGERITAQEARQWRHDDVEVLDELPVVAGEAEEATQGTGGLRGRPGSDRRNLFRIHGDPLGGDDVAEVRHRRRPK